MPAVHDPERSRLLWRCRRGRKELDLLLLDWMDRHFESATIEQRAGFARLLELPDPDLERYLMGLGGALSADPSRLPPACAPPQALPQAEPSASQGV
jgi:antitoxin CptB